MSLNLWKIKGGTTSYNPLPSSNYVDGIPSNIDLTVRFKASSTSGTSRIRVYNNAFSSFVTPTTIEQSYEIQVPLASGGRFHIYDVDSKGDIKINSIELVQKPLPKLTINGIDGFKSGKWNLHTNAVAVDDETLVLNATANFQGSSLKVLSPPNTQVTVNIQQLTGKLNVWEYTGATSNGLAKQLTSSLLTYTFTTKANTDSILLELTSDTLGAGQFTFKRPMLNLGSIPAPYEPKRGERMVLPVAKKNLFNLASSLKGSGLLQSWYNPVTLAIASNTGGFPIDLKAGVTYTLSGSLVSGTQFQLLNASASVVITSNSSFTPSVSETYYLRVKTDANGAFQMDNFQLEQGTTATAYTPYAVQVNPRPKKWVPKKNLIFNPEILFSANNTGTGTVAKMTDETIPYWRITASAGNISTYATPLDTSFYTPVDGKVYTISCEVRIPASGSVAFYSTRGSNANIPANTWTKISYTFTYTSNPVYRVLGHTYGGSQLDYRNFQIEEGSTQTVYEPYTLVLPKAKTGLSFNGLTDYLQLPSMTMDSVEIECLIDVLASQPSTYNYLFDARTGLTNGYIYSGGGPVGSSVDKFFVDGIDKTSSKLWSDIPKGQRTKVKASFVQMTDNVTIFGKNDGSTNNMTKGTIYKVTCYLNNAIVAQYDFENNRFTAGSTVLPVASGKSKNFIPSYQNWTNKNGNAVQLSDYSYSIPAGSSISYTLLNILPNTNYAISLGANSSNAKIGVFTSDGLTTLAAYSTSQTSFNSGSNSTVRLYIREVDNTKPVYVENWQLEEGTTVTQFTPYQWVQTTQAGNLIPSFEDARWSIHANAKVLGRDVLHLDATGTSQYTTLLIPVTPSTSYRSKTTVNSTSGSTCFLEYLDSNGNTINTIYAIFDTTVTTPSNCVTIRYRIGSGGVGAGSYDFIRPQLYQLNGKEGTLNGTPIQLNKHSKRRLYAKR